LKKWRNVLIDRLVLGTVQLGLEYGINNKHGKPSIDYAFQILDKAYEIGIRIFDTAFAYGNAEEVLGTWIVKNGLSNEIKVISKLKPNIFDELECTKNVIRDQICQSLERLKIVSLDGYLLHTPAYVYRDEVLEGMVYCKEEGLIKNCGVSIYEEKDALYAAENELINYIQVPYNVLDQRLDKTDFFSIARDNGKIVFARSPFVQGLIFVKDEAIPEHLLMAGEYLKSFDKIISKYNLTRLDASMLFPLYNTGNNYIVFGVDTIEQLVDDCDVVIKNKEISDCINSLKKEFGITEKSVVIPSLWKK
jgi:aryl-alcohol dehydrogenase-like predicted oxidoreductase